MGWIYPFDPNVLRAATAARSLTATHHTQCGQTPDAAPSADQTNLGIVEHWRARKHARLVSSRRRRTLASRLRRTANRVQDPDPIRRRRELLLCDRVAAVRTDLLEIAVMLAHTRDPDRESLATLCELLSDGCESPLYNRDVHLSELRATLHYVRSRLTRPANGAPQATRVDGAQSHPRLLFQHGFELITTSTWHDD